MKKKMVSVLLTAVMTASALAGCGSSKSAGTTATDSQSADSAAAAESTSAGTADTAATADAAATQAAADGSYTYTAGSYDGVKITMLNTKSEIQDQLEAAAEKWGELTGATLDVYTISSDAESPAEEIATKYAAGDAPTLIMGDPQDVYSICEEKGVDLSDQPWVSVGGSQYGITNNDKVYSFPFCIEGRGLIYNASAIEKVTGTAFDPSTIKSMDDFTALLDKLVAGGMKYPVSVNCEDWSLAGHYMTQVYEMQDGATSLSNDLIDQLYAGTADLNSNPVFTEMFNTFDVLKKYNINQKDPMSADRDESGTDLAEGTIAFWFDGCWAWDTMEDSYDDSSNIGIMPIPVNDTTGNSNIGSYICGSPTKQVMIDKEDSDEKQQAAAEDFLNWLVFSQDGQNVLVNECSLVPAFTNITAEATNPLAKSVQQYSAAGKLFPGYINYPSDHWQKVGAIMQQYLAGKIDRAEFAKEVQAYWSALKK